MSAPGNPFVDPVTEHAPGNPFVDRPPVAPPGAGTAAAVEGTRKLADIALSAPQIAGDTLALGGALPSAIGALVPGGEGPVDAFRREFSEQQQKFPASALRAINLPDANQVLAGVRSVPSLVPGGEKPSEAFDRNLATVDIRELRREARFPLATGAAELGADLAAFLLTKKPFSKRILSSEARLISGNPLAFGNAVKVIASNPTYKAVMKDWATAPGMKLMYRGAGRSVEAGAEATMLEIINGRNPAELAALASGLQAGGSMFLTGLRGVGGKGTTDFAIRVAAAGAGVAAMYQMMNELVPGDERVLESLDFGFEKVLLAISLGLMSGAVGAGRMRGGQGSLQRNKPLVADALNTIHRGTLLGMLGAFKDGSPEQRAQIEQTLDVITTNPDAISEKTHKKLLASITDGTFVETIDGLASDAAFQKALLSNRSPKFRASDSPKFGKSPPTLPRRQ